MQTNKYTFWKLINEYKIEIPIIQRDYAQGRSGDKIPEIRKFFLGNLYHAINGTKSSIDFDFVYGSIEENGTIKKLTPLDGQQRLTTLFLLHWYLAVKDNQSSDLKNVLSRFSYETRISSRDFCHSLVEKGIDLAGIDIQDDAIKISDLIKDAYWFYLSWTKDPTIKSMLVMLDDIHKEFKNTNGCFEKLKLDVNNNPPVTFRFLELKNFGLTDNLYIKMNARGKMLTDFENFKAKFGQLLNEYHPQKTLDYSKKIDNLWTDVFWKYKDQNHTIDNPFMRYMYFITEMLYVLDTDAELPTTNPFIYNENNVPNINYDLIKVVYTNKENVEFFMDSMDFWNKILIDPDEFIGEIFTDEPKEGKVVVFDGKSNLWNRCLTGDAFGIAEKIMLFSIIKRCISLNEYNVTVDLVDFARIIRNLLLRVRQALNTKYISNLRFDFMRKQLSDITNMLMLRSNVYQILASPDFSMTGFANDASEIEKAKLIINSPALKEQIHKLEDNRLFKGCLDNVLELVKDNPGSDLNAEITDIWSNKNILLIKALLAVGDYSITIGYSALGARKYFGNGYEWNLILTRTTNVEADRIKSVLKGFMEKYWQVQGADSKQKLEQIVKDYLEQAKKNWEYYFVKYDEFINENNVFTWKNDYEIRKLNGNSLLAYHINPYVKTVATIIADNDICDVKKSYGINGEVSPLKLKNGITMECLVDGWKVRFPTTYTSKNSNDEFKRLEVIANPNNEYWLKEIANEDRIETAVNFIKSLVSI